MTPPEPTIPCSFRLTRRAVALLQVMARDEDLNRTRFLEWLIRHEAERRGIVVPMRAPKLPSE